MIKYLTALTFFLASCQQKKQVILDGTLNQAILATENPNITYTPIYTTISYPMGDVNPSTGVCTDVVIRAYRKIGIDLQRLVHEDMLDNFTLYPNKWGLTHPDSNIDHRRVPNLMVFFQRKGETLPLKGEYQPGDIVTWELSRGVTHIGLVTNQKEGDTYKVLHNIGRGQVIENVLHNYKIIGHYKYTK